jgi:hypothetical protein
MVRLKYVKFDSIELEIFGRTPHPGAAGPGSSMMEGAHDDDDDGR